MAGESSNGWRQVTLGELGEVNRGRSRHRPRYAEHLYGGPYPFVQTGDIKQSGGKITTYEQTYSEAGLAQSRLWPAGTMAITIAANIAETAILTFPACFPDSVVGFIANEEICDVRFIEYTFRNLKRQIQHEATGSVQDNINLGTLQRLYFPLPDLREQRAIASILSALDDKIALNRRMNATLESLARAIFKSWFVAFEPVRMKSEGRMVKSENSDSELSPFTLPPSLFNLFPSTFQDSDLGKIPEGWCFLTLEDAMESIIDYRGKTPKKTTSGIPLVTAKIVKGGRILPFTEYIAPEDYDTWMRRGIPNPGDIVMTTEAPLGEIAQLDDRKVALAQRIITLRGNPELLHNSYLRFLMQSPQFQYDLLSRASGTTVFGIKQSELRKLSLLLPPIELQNAFAELVVPMTDRINRNWAESLTLSTLRDTLLPKLLSGELPVPAALTATKEALA